MTYGAVIVVTVLSVVAYYYIARGRTESPAIDSARTMAVGSVWIPVYPGSTVEGTVSAARDGATESTLNFATRDQAGAVLSFYQAALKKGVFRFDTVTKSDDGGSVRSIVHEGKTIVVVTIRATGEGSRGEIRTVDKETRK